MPHRVLTVAKAAFQKPPHVVAFRVHQEMRLLATRLTNGFSRIEAKIARHCDTGRTVAHLHRLSESPIIVAEDGGSALRIAAETFPGWRQGLIARGEAISRREFSVLGAKIPAEGSLPWHSDWRYGHEWQPTYFRNYRFYESSREQPYDVKVPWELARLSFLPPLAQLATLQPERNWHQVVLDVLTDWERRNPLGHSVAWYPMEAAMRSISILLTLELLLSARSAPFEALIPFVRLLAAHGEFVWKTLEYTDIRGNHFAAEVVSLLLIGLALKDFYPGAEKWIDFGHRNLAAEIELQFLPDGVHFEKSVAYHRLVTELCLIGEKAAGRAGLRLKDATRERLRSACDYAAACRYPTGLSPNVGDNDDGHILSMDPLPLRDHHSLLSVAAAHFQDATFKTQITPTAAMVWLCGQQGLNTWLSLPVSGLRRSSHFKDGGVVIVRGENSFFWMDVGEVGTAGLGGHGHNDILSFEILLDGALLLIDPGCSVYTGDASLRNHFRSTASHNTLRIDGIELAPMSGMWRIGEDAHPSNVCVEVEASTCTVRAGHNGYLRLEDPVAHLRTVRVDLDQGWLRCQDDLTCEGSHVIERFLHFPSEVKVSLEKCSARCSQGNFRWTLTWDASTSAHLVQDWVSHGYGHQQAAPLLVLKTAIHGDTTLHLAIDKNAEDRS